MSARSNEHLVFPTTLADRPEDAYRDRFIPVPHSLVEDLAICSNPMPLSHLSLAKDGCDVLFV